jgi:hypothetical protein
LPTGIEEASNVVADGKVGTAYIQELRFNEYCKRLQSLLITTFDEEFKLWMTDNGITIDNSLFELKFNTPQNFAVYRQAEMDTARITSFTALQEVPHISKRFALKRFLGLTEEEIRENERLWREENAEGLTIPQDAAGQLRGVGITPGNMAADAAGANAEAPAEMTDATAGGEAQVGAEGTGAAAAPAP